MELQPTQELAIAEHAQKLGVLATQLGYQGSLTVGALEDEIRFYQRRTVEACLELGKRLILLKELTPHGEFNQRTEMLNINERTAQRFISAALKFSKSDNLSLLKAAGNQSKLLELLVLDDEDIAELNDGGSVNDITLDDIDRMTASELRKKLREAKLDNESKQQIIDKDSESLKKLKAENAKLTTPTAIKKRQASEAEQLEQQALQLMQQAVTVFLEAVSTFNDDMGSALEACDSPYIVEQYQANIRMTYQSIATRCNESGLPIDFAQMVTPDWLADAIEQSDTAEVFQHQGSEA